MSVEQIECTVRRSSFFLTNNFGGGFMFGLIKKTGSFFFAPLVAFIYSIIDAIKYSKGEFEGGSRLYNARVAGLLGTLALAMVLIIEAGAAIFSGPLGALFAFSIFYVGSAFIRFITEAIGQTRIAKQDNVPYKQWPAWEQALFGTSSQQKPSLNVSWFKEEIALPLVLLGAGTAMGFGLFAVSFLSVPGEFLMTGWLANPLVPYFFLAIGVAAFSQFMIRAAKVSAVKTPEAEALQALQKGGEILLRELAEVSSHDLDAVLKHVEKVKVWLDQPRPLLNSADPLQSATGGEVDEDSNNIGLAENQRLWGQRRVSRSYSILPADSDGAARGSLSGGTQSKRFLQDEPIFEEQTSRDILDEIEITGDHRAQRASLQRNWSKIGQAFRQMMGVRDLDPHKPDSAQTLSKGSNIGLIVFSILLLAGSTAILFFIFSGLIPIGSAVWAMPLAASLGLVSWFIGKQVLSRTHAGPYGEWAAIVGTAATIFTTLAVFTLFSIGVTATSIALSTLTVGVLLGGAVSLIIMAGLLALEGYKYAHREDELRADQRTARFHKGIEISLNVFKVALVIGFSFLAFLSVAVLFNLTGYGNAAVGGWGGLSNLMELANKIIEQALGQGGYVVGNQWLAIFSITSFAFALTGAVLTVKSLLQKSPSSVDDLKHSTWRTNLGRLLKLAFTIGPILVLVAFARFLPGADTALVAPFAIVAALCPLFSGNSNMPSWFGSAPYSRVSEVNTIYNKLLGVTPLESKLGLIVREVVVGLIVLVLPLAILGFPSLNPTSIVFLVGGVFTMLIRAPKLIPNYLAYAGVDFAKPATKPLLRGSDSEQEEEGEDKKKEHKLKHAPFVLNEAVDELNFGERGGSGGDGPAPRSVNWRDQMDDGQQVAFSGQDNAQMGDLPTIPPEFGAVEDDGDASNILRRRGSSRPGGDSGDAKHTEDGGVQPERSVTFGESQGGDGQAAAVSELAGAGAAPVVAVVRDTVSAGASGFLKSGGAGSDGNEDHTAGGNTGSPPSFVAVVEDTENAGAGASGILSGSAPAASGTGSAGGEKKADSQTHEGAESKFSLEFGSTEGSSGQQMKGKPAAPSFSPAQLGGPPLQGSALHVSPTPAKQLEVIQPEEKKDPSPKTGKRADDLHPQGEEIAWSDATAKAPFGPGKEEQERLVRARTQARGLLVAKIGWLFDVLKEQFVIESKKTDGAHYTKEWSEVEMFFQDIENASGGKWYKPKEKSEDKFADEEGAASRLSRAIVREWYNIEGGKGQQEDFKPIAAIDMLTTADICEVIKKQQQEHHFLYGSDKMPLQFPAALSNFGAYEKMYVPIPLHRRPPAHKSFVDYNVKGKVRYGSKEEQKVDKEKESTALAEPTAGGRSEISAAAPVASASAGGAGAATQQADSSSNDKKHSGIAAVAAASSSDVDPLGDPLSAQVVDSAGDTASSSASVASAAAPPTTSQQSAIAPVKHASRASFLPAPRLPGPRPGALVASVLKQRQEEEKSAAAQPPA